MQLSQPPRLAGLFSDIECFTQRVDPRLNSAIDLCEKERDYQTREVLEQLLADTEMDHAYWLEKQLGLIEKIGLQNYLQSQMGGAEG